METAIEAILRASPPIRILLGLIIIGMFSLLGISSWQGLSKMPERPVPIKIEALADTKTDLPLWVSIENGQWDCSSIMTEQVGSEKRTNTILHSQDKQIVVVAQFSGEHSCAKFNNASAVGTINPMNEARHLHLADKGIFKDYPDAVRYFDLWAYGGIDNARGGVIMSIIAVAVGIAFVVWGIKGMRSSRSSF